MKKKTFESVILKILKREAEFQDNMTYIKKYYSYIHYLRGTNMLYNNKFYSQDLMNFTRIDDVNELFLESNFPVLLLNKEYNENDFLKDFQFLMAVLENNKSYIIKFNELRIHFERNYLTGRYKAALDYLEKIKEQCGLSFWYIESKILVLHGMDYSEYSDYYSNLKESFEDIIFRDYIRLLNRKTNIRTSQSNYHNFFKNFEAIRNMNESYEIIVDYIEFMQFEQLEKMNNKLKRNLCIIGYHLSIVDAFLLYKRMIDNLYSFEKESETARELCPQFFNIFVPEEKERGEIFNSLKKNFCNNISLCADECVNYLKTFPERFEILDIYVKCIFLSGNQKQIDDNPLGRLIDALVGCYQKQNEIIYAIDCIEICNRYLRAFSNFSSYYELLNTVADRTYIYSAQTNAFYEKKIYNRRFMCAEGYFFSNNPADYLLKLHELYGTAYVCDWNLCLRKKFHFVSGIKTDTILQTMITIDNSFETHAVSDDDGLQRLYYEEYIINKFQDYLNKKEYINAIHVYMDAYIKCKFLVLRMDVPSLNNKLPEFACRNLLPEFDFFLYANITDLNRYYDDIISQTVVDSFASILLQNNISKPTDIVDGETSLDEKQLMFLEFSCNDILNQSPCDLYDEQMFLEQIRILKIIISYKKDKRYQIWLSETEQQYDYFQIENKMNYVATDKIIADWIHFELDSDMLSSWEILKNYSREQITNEQKVLSDFIRLFASCKKNYVKQINSLMGVTIRHGILEAEFVQLLKKYDLFIPTCDEQEENNMKQHNRYLIKLSAQEKDIVFREIQKQCLNFFDYIEDMKKDYIFFTHKEKEGNFTSMYVTTQEIKERILAMGEFKTELKLVEEMKRMFDAILTDRLELMKNVVVEKLKDRVAEFFHSISMILPDETIEELSKFKEALRQTILTVGAWFHLSHNGQRLCDINSYIDNLHYNDIDIHRDIGEQNQITLNALSLIDCIIKNIVSNIEKHSGHTTNLKGTDSVISIKITADISQKVMIYSRNKVSNLTQIDRESIENINNMIEQAKTNSQDEIDDSHGLGYKRIAEILVGNFNEPEINAKIMDDFFCVTISFECRGGI